MDHIRILQFFKRATSDDETDLLRLFVLYVQVTSRDVMRTRNINFTWDKLFIRIPGLFYSF